MFFRSRLQCCQFVLLTVFLVFPFIASLSAQQIVVDPDNEGATDVVYGPSNTQLTNPVNSPLVLNEDLRIGNTALGSLAILNGGFVANNNGTLGNLVGSIGQVRVDGINSQWINRNVLTVGDLGAGVLRVTNGAQVVGSDGGILGNQAGSFGQVTIDGANSEFLINGGDFRVGNAGTGFLQIQNGGQFVNDNGLGIVGDSSTGVGAVSVSGTNSLLEMDFLVVGNNSGQGSLDISGGALVTNEGRGVAGSGTGSIGNVTVDGPGTRWEAFGIEVGTDGGTGNLEVTNGGRVETLFADRITIGDLAGSTGSALVDGSGSILSSQGSLLVGSNGGNGTLEVTNGGAVEASRVDIADNGGLDNSGRITVDGAGSSLNVSGGILVGFSGSDTSATLEITNGGLVTTSDIIVTNDPTNSIDGRVIVSNGGELKIREGSVFLRTPTLTGGTITFEGDRVYDPTNGAPNFNVNGVLVPRGGVLSGGERLKVEGQLSALSQITIDGGELSAGSISGIGAVDLVRGALELTATDVDVTGSGALGDTIALTTNQELRIGQTVRVATDGRIELSGGRLGAGVLENRGVISGSGRIDGPLTNRSMAEVRTSSGETLVFTGAGSVNEGEIRLLGTGDARIDFQQGLTNSTTGRISGRGSLLTGGLNNEGQLLFSDGTSDVTGDVNNTGITDVSGGAVATFFDDFDNEGTLRVVSVGNTNSAAVFFGELSGSGDITGGGDIFALGDLRPGSSPGSVDVDANLFLGSTTFTEIEIAGLEIGEFDQLVIDGDLSVAGDLDVSLLDGFELMDGLEFLIFDVTGTVSGNFDGLLEGDLVGRFGDQDLFISYAAGDGNDIGLFSISSVPEPSSAGIMLIGMVAALVQRRKRT